MSFQLVDVDKLYREESNLKREDVEILAEWVKKQPHLPNLTELQLVVSLHSCYYRIEAAKTTLDTYYTVKTHCPEIFESLSRNSIKHALSVVFIHILPKKTPEGYAIMLMKLTDTKLDNFSIFDTIRTIYMITALYVNQHGIDNGMLVLFDMKDYTLGHLTKINVTVLKKAFYLLQEGAPFRLKGVHFINVISFVDKVIGMVKPFLKAELYNMLNFHSNSIETLYKYIPKEWLPEDYGGDSPTISILYETAIKNIMDNFDFFAWHDSQKVDESKRLGKPKNVETIFGTEGTFRKLEID